MPDHQSPLSKKELCWLFARKRMNRKTGKKEWRPIHYNTLANYIGTLHPKLQNGSRFSFTMEEYKNMHTIPARDVAIIIKNLVE